MELSNFYNVGFIIYDDFFKNILLVKGYLGWGIPKGYFEEKDINFLNTGIREVKEELGLKIDKSNVLNASSSYSLLRYNKKYKKYDWGEKLKGFYLKNIIIFSTKINKNTVLNIDKNEIKETLWIPIDKINNFILTSLYPKDEKEKLINSINKINNIAINLNY